MSLLAEIIGKVVKAILDAFLGKTKEKKETYRDPYGPDNPDDVFSPDDW